ncbi:MAG: IPT/TIG domain-containing protein, partial [Acidobacteria bacterium]|nr:IPT/TIG domain-containing protein [Acidobacteriota bacterium]
MSSMPVLRAAEIEALSIAHRPSATIPVEANGDSDTNGYHPPSYADLSSTGRFVVYSSAAPNVVAGVGNPDRRLNLYLYDRAGGATIPVNRGLIAYGPYPAPFRAQLSEDGGTVVFVADGGGVGGPPSGNPAHYVFDRASESLRMIAHATPDSEEPWPMFPRPTPLSADGSWAAVRTTSGLELYQKTTGTLHAVPLSPGCGAQALSMSGDGRFTTFTEVCSIGAESGDLILFDRENGIRITVTAAAQESWISRDGRFILLTSARRDVVPGQIDSGDGLDLFRYDRLNQEMILVSRGATPFTATNSVALAKARISDDGGTVAFVRIGGSINVFESSSGTVRVLSEYSEKPFRVPGVALSGDGGTVAYDSGNDIVVWNRSSGVSRIVTNTGFPGVAANGKAYPPFLSRDGSLVAFASESWNLGQAIRDFDGYGACGTSLYGVELPADRVVPLSLAEPQNRVQAVRSGPLLSSNGRFSTFVAMPNAASQPIAARARDIPLLRDRLLQTTQGIDAEGLDTEGSRVLALSGDGSTSVLTYGDPGRERFQELVVYRNPDGRRWQLGNNGSGLYALAAAVSADGGVVAHTRLLDSGRFGIGILETATGQLTALSVAPDEDCSQPVVSGDGRFVAFVSAPAVRDTGSVFLYDRSSGSLERISGPDSWLMLSWITAGQQSSGRLISADGRFLLLSQSRIVHLYDRLTRSYTNVSGGGPVDLHSSWSTSMSADGRFVAFTRNGHAGPTHGVPYLFDRLTGTEEMLLASVPQPWAIQGELLISADGSTLAVAVYEPSRSSAWQAYVLDRRTGRMTLASHSASEGSPGSGDSFPVALDEGGDVLGFRSSATDVGLDLGYVKGICPEEAAFLHVTPAIAYSVAPSCASTVGGRTVTIEGAHFKEGTTVSLDGVPAVVTHLTSRSISVTVGSRAAMASRPGNVDVRSPNGETTTLTNAFTYAVRGDANNSGALTAADGFYLNMALFLGGP